MYRSGIHRRISAGDSALRRANAVLEYEVVDVARRTWNGVRVYCGHITGIPSAAAVARPVYSTTLLPDVLRKPRSAIERR